jgi:threonine/homoserine/homoserine lactone efflux protein
MFLEKILLGVTLAAPIGPVCLEMIKRGLYKGFWGAYVIRLGAAVGNTLCLVAAYFGLGLFMDSDLKMGLCSLGGALVLIYLGAKSLFDKRKHELAAAKDMSIGIINGLFTGFILSIASPIGIIFWLSIFAATLDHTSASTLNGLLQNFSIILGVLLWGAFLSGLLELGSRFINHKLINIITAVAGLMLIGFGIKFAYKGFILLA